MRIYTCALFPWKSDTLLFTRDSGLTCMALRELGHDSKVIMPPLPEGGRDESELVVRGTDDELRNPQWWRGLGIDAVAFVIEPFGRYTPIIRAARRGGVYTCAIWDTNSNAFPYFEIFSTIKGYWRRGSFSQGMPSRIAGTAARAFVFAGKGLYSHYRAAILCRVPDISGYNSPTALARAERRDRIFFWREPTRNMVLLGFPIPDRFRPLPLEQRKEKVVAVARWDAVRHKRPHLLMKVVEGVLGQDAAVLFEIFGIIPDFMRKWHAGLPENIRGRAILAGRQAIEKVASAIGESMILYCPSATEGVPLPVIEGLCGGCTVVGLNTADIPGLAWPFQEGDGTPAKRDSIDAHVSAVIEELKKWRNRQREPFQIAKKWAERFSAPSFCKRLAAVLESNGVR